MTRAIEPLEFRRLMAAGDLDPSFGVGGVVDVAQGESPSEIEVMPDGKIVTVGRRFDEAEDEFVIVVRRFLANGSRDPSFGGEANGQPTGTPAGTVLLSGMEGLPTVSDVEADLSGGGGLYLAGGAGATPGGDGRFAVVALNGNGTINTQFGGSVHSPGLAAPGIATIEFEEQPSAVVSDLAVSQDGRLALLGDASFSQELQGRSGYLAILDEDGELTRPVSKWGSGFRVNGTELQHTVSNFAGSAAFTPDGLLVTTWTVRETIVIQEGGSDTTEHVVRAWRPDGILAWSKHLDGPVLGDLQPADGPQILAGGGVLVAGRTLIKLTADGELDPGFGDAGVLTINDGAGGRLIEALPDGRFYVQAAVLNPGETKVLHSRYLIDGSPDPSFPNGLAADGDAGVLLTHDLALTEDGSPLVLTMRLPSFETPELIKLRKFDGDGAALTSRGTLVVGGTSGDDEILVRRRLRDGRIVATVNGEAVSFPPSCVKRIEVYGHGGDDVITIEAERRAASVNGGDGNDAIIGSDGNDLLLGGLGHDTITGGLGDDTLEGNGGNDYLLGSAGHDSLSGNGGRDTLSGAGGNDRLFGGPGSADRIIGGAGDDAAADDPLDTYSGVETLLS